MISGKYVYIYLIHMCSEIRTVMSSKRRSVCKIYVLNSHICKRTSCLFRNRMSRITSSGPRQANLVLIAYASSEGSGEPAPSLLAHTSSESRGTFRQKARSLAPLNGWACAVEICHDGLLEDTNSLDGALIIPALTMAF